jgi:hypothetical protein
MRAVITSVSVITKIPMSDDIFLSTAPTGLASSLLTSRPVSDGEPVNAATTNRLPGTNAANTSYLHSLIKQGYNQAGEYLWGMPIADDVIIGDFVYYAAETRRFEKGLAAFVSLAGVTDEADASAVWGVVTNIKYNKADICIDGLCTFKPTSSVYRDQSAPGLRFLSSRNRGEPIPEVQTPFRCLGYLVGVKQNGEVQFFVRPYLVNDPRVHQHRSYELCAAQVSNTDDPNNTPGWLPADHALFGGKAPENAVYGYNPRFLEGCGWPLRFVTHAGLRWQRGFGSGDDPWQAFVPQEFYRIDETTIWWLDMQHAPWDTVTQDTNGITEEVEEHHRFRMWLDVTKTGHGLNETLVSSLRAEPESGLVIQQYPYGGSSFSGDLIIGHNLVFKTDEKPEASSYAVRKLEGHNIFRTPNVAGLRIDSTWFRILKSDQTENGFHFGNITIGDPTGKVGRELSFEAIHLNGVEEAVEREAIGLAFPEDRTSFFLARIAVPLDTVIPNMSLSLFFGILLPGTGTIADNIFRLSYRIVRTNGNNSISNAFPEPSLLPIPCNFGVRNTEFLTGYYTAESEPFSVVPGDMVFVKMERTPPDNFNDRIILLRKSAVIHSGS